MEGELLSSSSSAELSSKKKTYTEVMNDYFPMYIEAGMTPHQYWDEDVELTKAFRIVLERKREWENQKLWLQGLYFYRALVAVMPALSIKVKNGKIEPYLDEPIPITDKQIRESEERKEKIAFEKNMAFMKAHMTAINARLAKKESEVKADG
ncbi:hypothetical protein J6O48_10595 [bacterium]|nr:hypothetical protein [bacterium]